MSVLRAELRRSPEGMDISLTRSAFLVLQRLPGFAGGTKSKYAASAAGGGSAEGAAHQREEGEHAFGEGGLAGQKPREGLLGVVGGLGLLTVLFLNQEASEAASQVSVEMSDWALQSAGTDTSSPAVLPALLSKLVMRTGLKNEELAAASRVASEHRVLRLRSSAPLPSRCRHRHAENFPDLQLPRELDLQRYTAVSCRQPS